MLRWRISSATKKTRRPTSSEQQWRFHWNHRNRPGSLSTRTIQRGREQEQEAYGLRTPGTAKGCTSCLRLVS